ncbi:MAG: hypothetical protein ACKPKO_13990, partial [Candidatus Fonsibacter sp.]
VSNNYEDVVVFVHEHYKDVKKTNNMLLVIEDQPRAARIDFPRTENPAYWCHKLQNKESLLKECKYRDMEPEELWRPPNRQIANVLISHDKTTVVEHKELPVVASDPRTS